MTKAVGRGANARSGPGSGLRHLASVLRSALRVGHARVQHVEQREGEAALHLGQFRERERRFVELAVGIGVIFFEQSLLARGRTVRRDRGFFRLVELTVMVLVIFLQLPLFASRCALPVREAYDAIEWPILIMLGALIPVSDSLRTTGASGVIATGLAHFAASLPPWGAVALILVSAMAVTPFLNNAATVLVMAPIAAVFAHDLGYRPEAFLIATAVGAGCDFLTPIGHQCNTLVFGPGGYRFSDYARLGAPLSLLVVLFGTPLILWVWPL